jgi:uncharacterized protein YeaO (DUF488 family)
VDGWIKSVAPSDRLRSWFGHEPAKWTEFQRRYFAELDHKPETWELLSEAARRGNITLVYGARDREHNNAIALQRYLERRLTGERRAKPAKLVGA